MSILTVSSLFLSSCLLFIDASPLGVTPYRELHKQFNFRNNRECYFSPITCVHDPQRNPRLLRMKSKRLFFDAQSTPIHRKILVFFDRRSE